MALNTEKDIREHVFPFLNVPDNATIKYTDMYYVRYFPETETRMIELDDSGKPPATVETMPLLTIELQPVKRVSDKVLTIDIHAAYAPEHKPPVIEKVAESMKATAAYNCWVDRQGRFDASQTYVMPDLIMGVDDAIADLRRGKLVIVGINHVEKVRRRIEIEERDE